MSKAAWTPADPPRPPRRRAPSRGRPAGAPAIETREDLHDAVYALSEPELREIARVAMRSTATSPRDWLLEVVRTSVRGGSRAETLDVKPCCGDCGEPLECASCRRKCDF